MPSVDCSGCHGIESDRYQHGSHGLHVAAGDSKAPRCDTCHDPHSVQPASDPESVLHRSRVTQICTRCHADQESAGGRATGVPQPAQSYARGAHAQAVAAGNVDAATCGDCHDSHAVRRAQDPESPVSQRSIPATCGKCHASEFEAFSASVHGKAAERGASGAPVCNTCHGEHAIVRLAEPGQTMVVASQTCESCHDNATLARRYDLPQRAVASYEDSYHGRAARGGLSRAAGCTSCHGVHRILAKDDSASSIYPARLVETCSRCHAGATQTFATSYAHAPRGATAGERAAGKVRDIYMGLIALVIGGMLLHNGVLLARDLRIRYREHTARATYVRLNRNELLQHLALFVTFSVLVLSGFALRYPDTFWARWLATLGFAEGVRRIVHRVAAVLFIALALVHLVYLFTRRGREQMHHMRPRAEDMRQALGNVLYHLGRQSRPPHFGRFRYIEKAEYWALVWGTAVMVGTGLVLWFPEGLQGPSWLVRVSEAVHLYEAWLAFLAIVVWHLFFVMLRPGAFPISFTTFTGRMDPEELAHEHPEEYARQYGSSLSREKLQPPPPASDPAEAPPLGAAAALQPLGEAPARCSSRADRGS
jgi:predicted CXXCH cytochrome family protein